jgi:hypothetical protein
MNSGSQKLLELAERRLELLRTLVRLEADWRRAFVALQMQESQRFVAEEEVFCEQIRMLDREIILVQANLPKQPANIDLDPEMQRRMTFAIEQMTALHADLKRSNDTRLAILKRSKVTINALNNLFNSFAPTYASPAAPSVGTIYEENV